MDKKNQISYITFSITDTQQLIKNIYTKLTVVITIIGAFVFCLYTNLGKLMANFCEYSPYLKLTIISLIANIVICIWLTAKILFPTHNPTENITVEDKSPKLKFFHAENRYADKNLSSFFNLESNKLKTQFEKYASLVNMADDEELLDSLIFELLKLSYIRNIKTKRLKTLFAYLIIATITFVLFDILFTYENTMIQH